MFHKSPLSKLWKSKVETRSWSKRLVGPGRTCTCQNVIKCRHILTQSIPVLHWHVHPSLSSGNDVCWWNPDASKLDISMQKKRSLYSFVCLGHPWHLQGHFVSLEFWGSNSLNSLDYSEEWILKNFYHLATLPILDWDWKKGMTTRNTQSCASKKQDSWKKPTLFPGKIHSLRHSIMHLLVTDPWNHEPWSIFLLIDPIRLNYLNVCKLLNHT